MNSEEPAGSLILEPVSPIDLPIAARSSSGLIIRVHEELHESRPFRRIATKLVRDLHANQTLVSLGDRLLALAEQSCAFRRLDIVKRICLALLCLPLDANYHSGALYYYALCEKRQGDLDTAHALFERLTEEATYRFRAKAFSSLAAIAMGEGDYQTSLGHYSEYSRIITLDKRSTLADVVEGHRALAVMKSLDGDHRGSLIYLEKVLPLAQAVRPVRPHTYYDFLNSLAVELSETGRIEEAQNASAVTLKTVFASAYPEWHETCAEIDEKAARKTRSAKSGASKPVNILPFPALALGETPHPTLRPGENRGRILSFLHRKRAASKNAVNRPGGRLTQLEIETMSLAEKQARLMRLIFQEGVSEKTLTLLLTIIEGINEEEETTD
jgi:tetratricopeptide (TPR) repeat protein